jgi:hypothetical protein
MLAAAQATEDYGRKVSSDLAARYPGEDQWRERFVWPEEGPERVELARLRAERDALMLKIRNHPTLEQARAEGCAKETHYALQRAAREPAERA